ncbi:amidohydrolase family protein [Paraburkholderia sp.]|uniref:amidohydrolase family protein n=1 Tax=Paraburkholderia sp. TaxID=1926495 RepID=UPI003D6F00A1
MNTTSTAADDLESLDAACDSHMHVYDARFAHADGARIVAHATADDYRDVQPRIGTRRTVVVTPRPYMTDNAVTLDAIRRLGADRTRGVAVLRPDVTDETLATLHAGGIRGIRFTLYTPAHAVTDFGMVEPLARRVHELGWHVQLHWTADQIVEYEALLRRLPTTIVFDHFARLPLPDGHAHPARNVVRRLLDTGRTWIKLSAPYLDSRVGETQRYADIDRIARGWVADALERLVWGSDWPHSTEAAPPDDRALRAALARWADDPNTRRHILVDNPAALYGFA